MARQAQRELPADLALARDRLATWRRTKKPRDRIPQALWKTAVELAGRHGLHRTARALNLDYYSLKKRVASAERGAENGTAFLELPPGLVPVPECSIEIEDGGGTLRVHLKGYSAADVATVGRGLRGAH